MSAIIFDIETGSLPTSEIERFCPQFEAPSNYKDAAKIEAYIAGKKSEWLDRTALSPVTGRVLAIGYQTGGNFYDFAEDDEAENLAAFWDLITEHGVVTSRLIGFNSNAFDIPFLIRRSWKLGVSVPSLYRGRYLGNEFVDLMDIWKCGNRDQSISLNDLAKFLNVGEKSGDGKNFQKLWETDRKVALAYLENDIRLIARCAEHLGLL